MVIIYHYNKNERYLKILIFDPIGEKQSMSSPFLKCDCPLLNNPQTLDLTNDLILKDS
jgi:hypothetical protein